MAEKSPALEPQIEVVRQLLAYIFDRNAALLPGYFIVNEILKSYPENPLGPNWTISSMMADFLNSFRPTAQMVSSTLKHRMRPIAEQSGKAHQISSWKIDPSTLKFLLKPNFTYDRILPYSKELVQPQREMLIYLLRQLSSKELVNRYEFLTLLNSVNFFEYIKIRGKTSIFFIFLNFIPLFNFDHIFHFFHISQFYSFFQFWPYFQIFQFSPQFLHF